MQFPHLPYDPVSAQKEEGSDGKSPGNSPVTKMLSGTTSCKQVAIRLAGLDVGAALKFQQVRNSAKMTRQGSLGCLLCELFGGSFRKIQLIQTGPAVAAKPATKPNYLRFSAHGGEQKQWSKQQQKCQSERIILSATQDLAFASFCGKKGLINTTSLSGADRLYRVLSFHAALFAEYST